MKTSLTVNLLDKADAFTGLFLSRKDASYGSYLKFAIMDKDGWHGTELNVFLQEGNLAPVLEALESITEKLREYLYHNSAARAYIWEEWKTAYDE